MSDLAVPPGTLDRFFHWGKAMQFSAESFIRNCETFLPVVEMLAKITGLKIISSIASVLRRATQYPETREQIIEWLKWTPLFGATAGEAGPQLPEEYIEIQDDLEAMRSGCDIYDADEADPTSDPTTDPTSD